MLQQLALVSQTPNVDMSELAVVSAALQKQVSRDFAPIWNIEATVDPFPRLDDVPSGYFPVIVRDDVQMTRGAKGVHLDNNNQPFALVQFTDEDTWPVFASHECLEMLVDPSLNRLVPGSSIKPDQGRVQYLLEVCDPCQDPAFSYRVNGVQVSDFHTPQYFDPIHAPGVRYSFTGALTQPREILDGGYLAWVLPDTQEWWAGAMLNGELLFLRVGPPGAALSLREFIDSEDRRPERKDAIPTCVAYSASSSRHDVRVASLERSVALQAVIDRLLRGQNRVYSPDANPQSRNRRYSRKRTSHPRSAPRKRK